MQAVRPYLRGRILDLACGYTGLPALLARRQYYVGVDLAPQAVDWRRRHWPQRVFLCRDLERDRIDLDGCSFDTVVMTAVIEHLDNPAYVLEQARSLLAAGGRLVLTTPSPFGEVVHSFGSLAGLFYPSGRVRHVRIYARRDLEEVLTANDFHIVRFRRFLAGTNQLVVCRGSKRAEPEKER